LPRFCSVSVTSQSSRRSFWNTIARFRNRNLAARELPSEHAQDNLRILTRMKDEGAAASVGLLSR
jgi:hypothetical protein